MRMHCVRLRTVWLESLWFGSSRSRARSSTQNVFSRLDLPAIGMTKEGHLHCWQTYWFEMKDPKKNSGVSDALPETTKRKLTLVLPGFFCKRRVPLPVSRGCKRSHRPGKLGHWPEEAPSLRWTATRGVLAFHMHDSLEESLICASVYLGRGQQLGRTQECVQTVVQTCRLACTRSPRHLRLSTNATILSPGRQRVPDYPQHKLAANWQSELSSVSNLEAFIEDQMQNLKNRRINILNLP